MLRFRLAQPATPARPCLASPPHHRRVYWAVEEEKACSAEMRIVTPVRVSIRWWEYTYVLYCQGGISRCKVEQKDAARSGRNAG
jgi:hypothetical protein